MNHLHFEDPANPSGCKNKLQAAVLAKKKICFRIGCRKHSWLNKDFCDFCLAEIIIKAKELQILRPSDVG